MTINTESSFCPVCGYDLKTKLFNYENNKLYFSAEITGETCPSCGSEFDYNLFPEEQSFEKNRINWIKNGMKFGSQKLQEKYPNMFRVPENWNPIEQLKNINIDLTNPKVLEKYQIEIHDINNIVKSHI